MQKIHAAARYPIRMNMTKKLPDYIEAVTTKGQNNVQLSLFKIV